MTRSGFANITPVLGFVFPNPPTPPSNALVGGGAWRKGRDIVEMVVDISSLWNRLLLEEEEDEDDARVAMAGMRLMEGLGT